MQGEKSFTSLHSSCLAHDMLIDSWIRRALCRFSLFPTYYSKFL